MSRRNSSARDLRSKKPEGNAKVSTSGGTVSAVEAVVEQSSEPRRLEPVAQIEAIEAAVEIIASHQPVATSTGSATKVQVKETSGSASQTSQIAPENRKSSDGSGKINPLNVMLNAFRQGLTELKTSLRDEFKTSLAELQASQTAAIASQSEVLRTLTEVMIQTSGRSGGTTDRGIESAIAGLEDRLMLRLSEWNGSAENATPETNLKSGATEKPKSGISVTTVKLKDASSVVSRSWEQIRSEMMAGGDLVISEDSPARQVEQLPEVAPLSSERHFRLPEQDLSLEIPKAVDPDSLNESQLREAFREREAFVSTLIARIRRQHDSNQQFFSTEQLQELVTALPDDLANHVRQTLKQMEDLARMGELELSLERARIARQVNHLEHTRLVLEHNAKQLGMTLDADGCIAVSKNPGSRSSSSRRWLGKLGFGQ